MPIPQKVCSHLLLAVIAFGGLTCPCPANAGSEAASHGHHGSQHESPAVEKDGYEHMRCAVDCDRISAESSREDAAVPCTGKHPFDDFDAVEAETIATIAWSGPARSVAWTGPPPQRLWLHHETPVRRFDRLLD